MLSKSYVEFGKSSLQSYYIFKISNTGMSRSPIVPQIEAHQWELFLSEINNRKTIAAIEANNDTL